MKTLKEHKEFYKLNLDEDWEVPEGYPSGIKQKIISGFLDEKNKIGKRTRLLKILPGTYTTEPFVHDFWEEVFLFSGDLRVGNNFDGIGGEKFTPLTYAVRPPGAYHGPFASDGGCIVLEIHYYSDK